MNHLYTTVGKGTEIEHNVFLKHPYLINSAARRQPQPLPLLVFVIPSLRLHLLFAACLLQLHELELELQFPDLFITVALNLLALIHPRISGDGATPSGSRPLGTRNKVLSLRSAMGHCRMSVLAQFIPRRQNAERIVRYVVDIADVVIKMRARASHTIEVFGLEQRSFQGPALLHLVELPIGKRHRRLESVLNLPAVPVAGGPLFVLEPVVLGEFADIVF